MPILTAPTLLDLFITSRKESLPFSFTVSCIISPSISILSSPKNIGSDGVATLSSNAADATNTFNVEPGS